MIYNIPWDLVNDFYPDYAESNEIIYLKKLNSIRNSGKNIQSLNGESFLIFKEDFDCDFERLENKHKELRSKIIAKAIDNFYFK